MHVIIEEAREGLKTQGIEPEFSEFEDRAFQDDLDIEILYNMALDGIEDTAHRGASKLSGFRPSPERRMGHILRGVRYLEDKQ